MVRDKNNSFKNKSRYRIPALLTALVLCSVLLLSGLLTSCGSQTALGTQDTSAATSVSDAPISANPAERVFHAVIEYPNEELYNKALFDSDKGKEKKAWQNAVGDCFADGRFDEFFDQYDRRSFLEEADTIGLTTSIENIEPADSDADSDGSNNSNSGDVSPDNAEAEAGTSRQFTVTVKEIDSTGKEKISDTVWLVKYDKKDPRLLESVDLLVDGGFFCRQGCSVEGITG